MYLQSKEVSFSTEQTILLENFNLSERNQSKIGVSSREPTLVFMRNNYKCKCNKLTVKKKNWHCPTVISGESWPVLAQPCVSDGQAQTYHRLD